MGRSKKGGGENGRELDRGGRREMGERRREGREGERGRGEEGERKGT